MSPVAPKSTRRLPNASRARLSFFFDGTLYTDDEMIRQGLLNKTGARMGHISISGPTARSPRSRIWM